ncbi:MAG: hypothetical protein IAG13_37765, partial [Deltaproteobacteria bacterium]|nr:hypothetical protein [Nannocystaceae bacterium]
DGSGAPSPSTGIARGTSLGRYVVIDPIGRGGMGVVVSADEPELDRKVAIKLLRWSDSDAPTASRGAARLLREAQALAKLAHPNVVAVHDVGTWLARACSARVYAVLPTRCCACSSATSRTTMRDGDHHIEALDSGCLRARLRVPGRRAETRRRVHRHGRTR